MTRTARSEPVVQRERHDHKRTRLSKRHKVDAMGCVRRWCCVRNEPACSLCTEDPSACIYCGREPADSCLGCTDGDRDPPTDEQRLRKLLLRLEDAWLVAEERESWHTAGDSFAKLTSIANAVVLVTATLLGKGSRNYYGCGDGLYYELGERAKLVRHIMLAQAEPLTREALEKIDRCAMRLSSVYTYDERTERANERVKRHGYLTTFEPGWLVVTGAAGLDGRAL